MQCIGNVRKHQRGRTKPCLSSTAGIDEVQCKAQCTLTTKAEETSYSLSTVFPIWGESARRKDSTRLDGKTTRKDPSFFCSLTFGASVFLASSCSVARSAAEPSNTEGRLRSNNSVPAKPAAVRNQDSYGTRCY